MDSTEPIKGLIQEPECNEVKSRKDYKTTKTCRAHGETEAIGIQEYKHH